MSTSWSRPTSASNLVTRTLRLASSMQSPYWSAVTDVKGYRMERTWEQANHEQLTAMVMQQAESNQRLAEANRSLDQTRQIMWVTLATLWAICGLLLLAL